VEITFDQDKRDRTFAERGLAFEDAVLVFAKPHLTIPDERRDYGEPRFLTFGYLESRAVTLAWTPRDGTCRVISMRRSNEREQTDYQKRLEQG